jgi:subtilisin
VRRAVILLAAIAVATLLASGVAMTQPAGDNGQGRYIVVLEEGVQNPGEVAREISRRNDAEVGFVYRNALKGFSAVIPSQRLSAVRADDRVLFISEDRKVEASAQKLPTGVDRIQGDVSSTRSDDGTGSMNTAVAIIDTGIDVDHPDLNVAGGRNCSTGRSYDDGNGHGTHVAGTVAAKDDASGVVGVAPGAQVYEVHVLNNAGSGSW